MVLLIQEIYGTNYPRNYFNQIEENPGLLDIIYSFPQIQIYTRGLETN